MQPEEQMFCLAAVNDVRDAEGQPDRDVRNDPREDDASQKLGVHRGLWSRKLARLGWRPAGTRAMVHGWSGEQTMPGNSACHQLRIPFRLLVSLRFPEDSSEAVHVVVFASFVRSRGLHSCLLNW
jgi:hypothetical protein